jgi:hypothetical protein
MTLSYVGAGLLAIMVFMAALAFKRRGDRSYAILALLGSAALLIALLVGAFVDAPLLAPIDLLISLVTGAVAAEALGLPSAIAMKLGVGFRSPEWEFDRTLTRLLGPLNAALVSRPPGSGEALHTEWADRLMRDGNRRIERLRQLRAPNADWRRLANAYADIYDTLLASIQSDAPAIDEATAAAIKGVDLKREQLRSVYRSEATRLLGESRAARRMRRGP